MEVSSAVVDRDVGGRDALGFSGRIPGSARPISPANQTRSMSSSSVSERSAVTKLPVGESVCLSLQFC